MRRAARVTAAAAVVAMAGLSGALLAGPAAADPQAPTAEEVRRARVAVDTATGELARLQGRLTAATAEQEAADLALSVAAEEYDAAAVHLERSRQEARLAREAADRASGRLEAARRDVGRLAAQSYRQGATATALAAMLSPRGPQDVADRAAMLRTVAGQRQRTVRRMDAARVVATVLERQAAEAVAEHEDAARRLAAAKAAAEHRALVAREVSARNAATSRALIARLAALRGTSIALERRRHEALTAQREAAHGATDRGDSAGGSGGGSPGDAEGAAERRRTAPARQPARRPRDRADADPPVTRRPAPSRPGGGSGGGGSSSGENSSRGRAAVAWARRQVGLPYQWGGDGPGSYDCSGLTMRAWERGGVRLPHSSRWQYRSVQKVGYDDLRPGDLIFYGRNPSDPDSIHHVAMYAGGGLMVEAPATGLKVRVVPLRRRNSMPYAGRL